MTTAMFAVMGYGAITQEIVRTLAERGALSSLAGVLVRPSRLDAAKSQAAGRFPVVAALDELLELRPDVVPSAPAMGRCANSAR